MQEYNQCHPTIGILYPGEMGASLGKLLMEHGFRVVTTLEGRSHRTRCLCTESRLHVLDGMEQVVTASRIILSLVPPAAAIDVAEQFCAIGSKRPNPPTYVDANSISPCTLATIEQRMTGSGVRFIDASLHGLASRLRQQGTLYLSGAGADELASLLAGVMRIRVLGDRPGMASLFKMLLGGVSKGLVGLILEMSLVSREVGLLDAFLNECRNYYPGVMDAIDRLLPTVPRHATRRANEMDELARTLDAFGLRASLANEIGRLYGLVRDSSLAEDGRTLDSSPLAVLALVELIGSRVSLRRGVADTPARADAASP